MIYAPDSNATIVASFDGQTPAAKTAREWDLLREEYENEKRSQQYKGLMRQTYGPCG
jgi:hypothetical protein